MYKNQLSTMTSRRTIVFSTIVLLALSAALFGWPSVAKTQQDQTAPKKQPMPTIDEYQPKSTLVTKEHKIERAKFPFIDIHSHHWNPTAGGVNQLVKKMEKINLRGLVNLSGGTGEELKKNMGAMEGRY